VLDALAREELGVEPKQLSGWAWTAAASSVALFVAGAIAPVHGDVSALLARPVARMFARHAPFTGRSALLSALFVIGIAAAAITYGVDALVDMSLGADSSRCEWISPHSAFPTRHLRTTPLTPLVASGNKDVRPGDV
jgi:hypothetical protein